MASPGSPRVRASSSPVTHPYDGRHATLATRHEKLAMVAPPFRSLVGLQVATIDVDTDSLGTFSGERERRGTQRETAIEKARLGMRVAGRSLGLATEASFGPMDGNPFVSACLEFVVLVDDERGVIIGEAEVDYGVPSISVDIPDGLIEQIPLAAAGFPEHGLIVRPVEGFEPITKGIHDLDSLKAAVAVASSASPTRTVRVENDLRAHHSPSRRLVIARAAQRLARRVAAICVACGAPGWGVVARNPGAPCAECGTATRLAMSETFGCAVCATTDVRQLPEASGVDARFCPRCNP